jgi:hypothetical protein
MGFQQGQKRRCKSNHIIFLTPSHRLRPTTPFPLLSLGDLLPRVARQLPVKERVVLRAVCKQAKSAVDETITTLNVRSFSFQT